MSLLKAEPRRNPHRHWRTRNKIIAKTMDCPHWNPWNPRNPFNEQSEELQREFRGFDLEPPWGMRRKIRPHNSTPTELRERRQKWNDFLTSRFGFAEIAILEPRRGCDFVGEESARSRCQRLIGKAKGSRDSGIRDADARGTDNAIPV